MTKTYTNIGRATHVVVDGPFAECDQYHDDEFPTWVVQIMHDEEEGKCYTVYSYQKALELGRNISRDRRIELVVDGGPA